MRSRLVRCLLAAGAAVAAGLLLAGPADDVEALTSGQVLGTWNLKLKGDGWAGRAGAADQPLVDVSRVSGTGVLVVRPRDPDVNDGLLTFEVVLDKATAKSLLGPATSGTPAFSASAALIGDSIGLIDAGQPNFVNAMTLRFDRKARKVTGAWMAVYPASDPTLGTQKFATAVSVTVKGRRTKSARR